MKKQYRFKRYGCGELLFDIQTELNAMSENGWNVVGMVKDNPLSDYIFLLEKHEQKGQGDDEKTG